MATSIMNHEHDACHDDVRHIHHNDQCSTRATSYCSNSSTGASWQQSMSSHNNALAHANGIVVLGKIINKDIFKVGAPN